METYIGSSATREGAKLVRLRVGSFRLLGDVVADIKERVHARPRSESTPLCLLGERGEAQFGSGAAMRGMTAT